MRKDKGSVLAITVGFALVFTMLGIASIYISTLQSETQEKQILSHQAFWLAEAEIQRALSQLPDILFNCSDCFDVEWGGGNYTYTITTGLKPGYNHRWVINSTGKIVDSTKLVTLAQRKIQAEAGANVINGFQTTGTLKPKSEDQISPSGSYSVGPENFTYTFAGIFGMSEDDMRDLKDEHGVPITQIVDQGGAPGPGTAANGTPLHDGIIWVNGDLKVTNNNNWKGYKGILIVNNGTFEMTGGTFEGIVWVNGFADQITGNPGVQGAVFVNDPNQKETKLAGGSAVQYDALAIDAAYDNTPNVSPETFRHIVRWNEL